MKARLPVGVLALVLTACGSTAGTSEPAATTSQQHATQVTLMTHDSFALPKSVLADFTKQTGYRVKVLSSGDAGELTNKLVLTAGNPVGDVAYGVDNTFLTRATDNGVFDGNPTPVDRASVCVNIDKTWFRQHHVTPPATLEDLTAPAYRNLLVIPGAATSSTGMSFLIATIGQYADGWQDYWKRLMANGAKLDAGWEDAYYVDFTQGGKGGQRPIVVSYDSSPAYTVHGSHTTTKALLDTCFQQVEYVGVLAGAKNVPGAEAWVRFMASPEVQAAMPENMYVFPVDPAVTLPKDWARFAVQPTHPIVVDPAQIAANREQWLQEWTDITSR